jgi:hypothetical protein
MYQYQEEHIDNLLHRLYHTAYCSTCIPPHLCLIYTWYSLNWPNLIVYFHLSMFLFCFPKCCLSLCTTCILNLHFFFIRAETPKLPSCLMKVTDLLPVLLGRDLSNYRFSNKKTQSYKAFHSLCPPPPYSNLCQDEFVKYVFDKLPSA